ncbi:hypothetical protein D3C71_1571410 [compost metagenome]
MGLDEVEHAPPLVRSDGERRRCRSGAEVRVATDEAACQQVRQVIGLQPALRVLLSQKDQDRAGDVLDDRVMLAQARQEFNVPTRPIEQIIGYGVERGRVHIEVEDLRAAGNRPLRTEVSRQHTELVRSQGLLLTPCFDGACHTAGVSQAEGNARRRRGRKLRTPRRLTDQRSVERPPAQRNAVVQERDL